MPYQTLALAPVERFTFEPQDRKTMPPRERVIGTILSLIVVGAAIYQARGLDFAKILALVPTSLTFWALFAISYLIGPASDWFIFQRLWGVGGSAFGALIRKLIYNEMLVGYFGEVYFYGWAHHNLKIRDDPVRSGQGRRRAFGCRGQCNDPCIPRCGVPLREAAAN